MSCETRFFVCKHCGNLIGMIHASGAPITCCGEHMTELTPNTVEASTEKHIPVISVAGDAVTVTVGAVAHPMLDEHYINWVYLLTDKGGQRKCLSPGSAPIAEFKLANEKVISAFAYCNLHGLWKADA